MKYVYMFSEGNKDLRELLGGKGANLAEMTNIGLPIPQGFTITTEACNKYYEDNEEISSDVVEQIKAALKKLEEINGKVLGGPLNPLLVSVRSGARASMPGMMDTILNLGLNDEVALKFAEKTGNPRFVYDSYRRFIQMFADVVMGFPKSSFEHLFDEIKKEKGKKLDTELTSDELKEIVEIYKKEYLRHAGCEFPQDVMVQLLESVKAVFRSWNNDRAITYRRLNDIPSSWGTAVNVQTMVYGNSGDNSATGVAFTRNPATGEKEIFGEFLVNAQGEDVVAGIRTPEPIIKLKEIMPNVYDEFINICHTLENHYKDMQDMEFTIEDGKLYFLQTRNGKRTATAAIKIAVDLVSEGVKTKEEALMMVEPNLLDQLLHPAFEESELKKHEKVAQGLAASPGSASGKIVFTAEDALKYYHNGEKELILVRDETSPEDIEGMNIVKGILTMRGGMTSHAAVVARGMGTCCVSGCSEITVDEKNKTLTLLNGKVLHELDYLSLDGSTGYVYDDKISCGEAQISGDFKTFMAWADDVRTLKIRTNADSPKDAKVAKEFGAEGIGLCRTEHMFFEEERIFNFRKMILSSSKEEREKALANILPFQQADFEGLFRSMLGYGVTIRLLDPPLHEFLPKEEKEIEHLANALEISKGDVISRINSLKEFNPMMGHRGCRLSITYPEIVKMQTTAIISAALNVASEGNIVEPEIMIPLVGDLNEYEYVKKIITEVADELISKKGIKLKYHVGTMIEIPRACMIADKLCENADFFSFGTNDLTQMTYGFSRDDAGKFLNDYYAKKIFESDPFAHIDEEGVGSLMRQATEKARNIKPDFKLGICGEHGGDAKSIAFCHRLGLTYVSCSPYRVPIARLAAARAAIKFGTQK